MRMSEAKANLPVALITGAAGGLGRALTAVFAAQGWRVAAGTHHALVEEGEFVHAVPLDVTDRDSVEQAVEKTLSRWGHIDALVNNAGVTADELIVQMSDDEWERVLAVNLKGAFLCSQAVVRAMMKRRDGHIINIASHSGRAGQRGQANYAAAKAGLIGLSQSLAKELGSRNVRVNAVLPGVLRTAMTAKLTDEQIAAYAATNALGRLNDVGEVARFLAFLATTNNISGQVFALDSRVLRWT